MTDCGLAEMTTTQLNTHYKVSSPHPVIVYRITGGVTNNLLW